MEHETLGNLQADLFQARVTLNQLRAEFESARTDTRVTADALDEVIGRAANALADLDNAISRIHRRLGSHGSAGSETRASAHAGLRAITTSVSPGQSQKIPSGERLASSARTSPAKSSRRSPNRCGAEDDMDK